MLFNSSWGILPRLFILPCLAHRKVALSLNAFNSLRRLQGNSTDNNHLGCFPILSVGLYYGWPRSLLNYHNRKRITLFPWGALLFVLLCGGFLFLVSRSPPSSRDLDTARSPVAGCVCSAFIEMWSEEVKKSPVVVFRLGVFSGACPRAVCSLFTLKGFARREKPRLFDFVKKGKIASLGITDNSMQNRTA